MFVMAAPGNRMLFGVIPWYSLLIVTGIVLGILLAGAEGHRKGLSTDDILDLALYIVPLGIVGARLYYVAFRWEDYAFNPVSVLYLWEGGLAIYGAVIGGALGTLLFCRTHKLSFGMIADLLAPSLILAQAIGRWGNYFNMEAYGPLVTEPALQFFPLCVLIGGTEWHMAVFFYEFLWNLWGFAALMALRHSTRRSGDVFLFYMLFYGSGRFVMEQLRQDSLYLFTLRVSQWLSLGICLAASLLLMRGIVPFRKRPLGAAFSIGMLLQWFVLKQTLPCGVLILICLALLMILLDGKKIPLAAACMLPAAAGTVLYALFWQRQYDFTLLYSGLLLAVSCCLCHILLYFRCVSPNTEITRPRT